jgi:hypothetical protein
LLYFVDIWCSSWYLGIFFPFWYFVPRKIWQPCSKRSGQSFVEVESTQLSMDIAFLRQGCQMVSVFANQISLFGYILEGLGIENVGIFCGHRVYFTAIWYILLPFGIFYSHVVHFMAILYNYFLIIWCIFSILVCSTKKNLAILIAYETGMEWGATTRYRYYCR